MIAMLARLRARAAADGTDSGSLAMALLVSVVAAGLAALLVPLVITQTHTTTFDDSRARELNAAEAGTDVALGLIRSATDSTGAGKVTALPCTTGSGASGMVAGADTGLTYRVKIAYYTDNPLGQSSSWLATYTPSNGGHGMICSSGKGTYYPPTKEDVPSYVLITSTGSDSRGSRTLQSTYFVRTTDANVAGGTIYVFPPSGATTLYCMDAGSARPIAGVTVQLQPCAKPVIQQQAWSYNTDLSIQLVSSVTSTYPNGLCLSAMSSGGTSQAAGNPITLQPCAEVGSAPWSQMWSVDNNAHLEGTKPGYASTPSQSGMDGLCINAASQGAGVSLSLASCAGTVTDSKQTWVPSPDVGAGMAGAANAQVVNFQQFGRCIDVTNQDVNAGFLIAYTCKQDPNPSTVAWNQKFALNSYGEWVTTTGGTNYCLTSPQKPYAGSTGPWVTVTPCPATPTAAVTWTQYGATDSDGNPEPQLDKYTVQDASGYCLSLTTDTSVAYNGQYSKVIVAACDGSTLQKWNASADIQTPALKNLMEIGTPTG